MKEDIISAYHGNWWKRFILLYLLLTGICIGLSFADVLVLNFCVRQYALGRLTSSVLCASMLSFAFATCYLYRMVSTISIKKQFYVGLLSFQFVFFVLAMCSHGEVIKAVLFADPADTFMDFFNSVAEASHPYRLHVIYPPLVNVAYNILRQFMEIIRGTSGTPSLQIGKIIFSMYLIASYGTLLFVLFTCKKGSGKEKALFVATSLCTIPFLYCLERGNSILWVIILLIFFLFGFDSSDKRRRRLSYCALGAAAGVKIVPAVFLFLLLQRRTYREFFHAVGIMALFFFMPFLPARGTPLDLWENIQYATKFFQGYEITSNGLLLLFGHGEYVNLSNFFWMLGRMFNLDLHLFSYLMNLFVFLSGILVVLFIKNFPRWKSVAILCGLLILCPGFSGIYNLIYMLIPLLLFLDSEHEDTKRNRIYVCLFLGIFAPLVNVDLNIFDFSRFDRYPMRISTLVESVSIIVMVLLLEWEAWKMFVQQKTVSSLQRYAIPGILVLVLLAAGLRAETRQATEAFYPFDMKSARAAEGFSMEDGQYQLLRGTGRLLLQAKQPLETGLLLCFSGSSIQEEASKQTVRISVNGIPFPASAIDGRGDYIYIEPSALAEMVLGETMELIIEHTPADEGGVLPAPALRVSYIGPTELLSNLENRVGQVAPWNINRRHALPPPSVLRKREEAFSKSWRDEIDNTHVPALLVRMSQGLYRLPYAEDWESKEYHPFWMGRDCKVLLGRKGCQDGIFMQYEVPPALLKAASKVMLDVASDGMTRKTVAVTESGPHVLTLSPEELGLTEQDGRKSLEIRIQVNAVVQDPLNLAAHMPEHSIRVDYLGPCGNLSAFSRASVPFGQEYCFMAADLKEYGAFIAYRANAPMPPAPVRILVNGAECRSLRYVVQRDDMEVLWIAPEYFQQYSGIVSIRCLPNVHDGLSADSPPYLLYVGIGAEDEIFSNDEYERPVGLLLGGNRVAHRKGIRLGRYAILLLDKESLVGRDLAIECHTADDLIWQERGKNVSVAVSMNKEFLGFCPLFRGTTNIVLPKESVESALEQNERFTCLEFFVDSIYFSELDGEEGGSIFLEYVGPHKKKRFPVLERNQVSLRKE